MAENRRERIKELKNALLDFLGTNGRYYGELTRLEQSVEDLAQALNTRLDQLLLATRDGVCPASDGQQETPGERMGRRFLEVGSKYVTGSHVDKDVADEFEKTLDALDMAADLRRKSETAKDAGETAAIKYKRRKV